MISLSLKDADINQDVESWGKKQFDVGEFDVNWASPPCTKYNRARTTGVLMTSYAHSIVLTTLIEQPSVRLNKNFVMLMWVAANTV